MKADYIRTASMFGNICLQQQYMDAGCTLVATWTSSMTIYSKNKLGHLVRESICHSINAKRIPNQNNYLCGHGATSQFPNQSFFHSGAKSLGAQVVFNSTIFIPFGPYFQFYNILLLYLHKQNAYVIK